MAEFLADQFDFILLSSGFAALCLMAACIAVEGPAVRSKLPRYVALFAGCYGLSEWLCLLIEATGYAGPLTHLATVFVAASAGFMAVLVLAILRPHYALRVSAWQVVAVCVVASWPLSFTLGWEGADSLWRFQLLPVLAAIGIVASHKRSWRGRRRFFFTLTMLAAVAVASLAGQAFGGASIRALVRVPYILAFLVGTIGILALGHALPMSTKLRIGTLPGLLGRSSELALLSLVVVVPVGWFVVQGAGERADAEARQSLLARTSSAAAALAGEDFAFALYPPEDGAAPPAFLRLRTELQAIRAANPDFRFVYVMTTKGEDVIFAADAEPVDSPDYSPPGQVYEDATPELRLALDDGHAFVEGPVRDQWGIWYSGLAAVRDAKTGAVVAMLGMDVPVDNWLAAVKRERFEAMAALGLAGLVLLIFAAYQERVRGVVAHLAASERRYYTLVEGSPNGIMLFDPQGYCRAINRAAMAATGWTERAVLGRHIDDLYAWVAKEELQAALEAVRQGRQGRLRGRTTGRTGGVCHLAPHVESGLRRCRADVVPRRYR